jgi:hypothetical protein
MMRASAFCLTLLVAVASAVPKPQDPVSVSDILGNTARQVFLLLLLLKKLCNKEGFVPYFLDAPLNTIVQHFARERPHLVIPVTLI